MKQEIANLFGMTEPCNVTLHYDYEGEVRGEPFKAAYEVKITLAVSKGEMQHSVTATAYCAEPHNIIETISSTLFDMTARSSNGYVMENIEHSAVKCDIEYLRLSSFLGLIYDSVQQPDGITRTFEERQ